MLSIKNAKEYASIQEEKEKMDRERMEKEKENKKKEEGDKEKVKKEKKELITSSNIIRKIMSRKACLGSSLERRAI